MTRLMVIDAFPECFCRFDVPKAYFDQTKVPESMREVDFFLINESQYYRCEVKLMGKGNPESADAIFARESDVFIADKLSDLNKKQANNGKEFAAHDKIAKGLGIDCYFARLYHSRGRGSNENLNGLIRQYIPKKTNFSALSDDCVQQEKDQLNNRPGKRFNFEMPNQMFDKMTKNQVAFVG